MPTPLVITQGDPAGIGPELVLKLLANPPCPNLKVIGCGNHLSQIASQLQIPFADDHLIDLPLPESIKIGEISPVAGEHSFACLEAAVEGAMDGAFSGVITNPIHKEAWYRAGKFYPGHTEYLVEKTSSPDHAMMLTSDEITCSLVTTHVSLASVPELLEEKRMLEVITLTHKAISTIK